jgi:ankyrin repeat protein
MDTDQNLPPPSPLNWVRGETARDSVKSRRRPFLLGSSFLVMLVAAIGLIAYIVLHTRHNMLVARLYDAVQAGDVVRVEEALRSGLDANERHAGRIPQRILMHAAQLGRCEVVRSLLRHGAAADARHEGLDQYHGRTALMFAAQPTTSPANVSDCIKELLAHGADVNARDAFDQTALIISIQNKQSLTSWHLLERGADPNVRDCFGKPALVVAIENDQFDTARHLLTKGADINGADIGRQNASLKRKRAAAGFKEILVAWNYSTNAPGRTALMAAVEKSNRELVELIIKAGGDANAHDKQGITPLKLAARTNSVEIVRILKAAGAAE